MAKTESTAVNQLISNLQTQKPLPVDPSEDLLFKVPAPVAVPVERRSRPRTSPAARDVPAIPRAANGTAEHNAVRMSTAQPRGTSIPPLPKAAQSSRSGIPLPRASGPMSMPASNPNITLPPLPTSLLKVDAERPAKTTLPPPPRNLPRPSGSLDAQGTPSPDLVARPSPRSLPRPTPQRTTLPPPSSPVAAPFEVKAPIVAKARPDAAPARPLTDMTSNQAWFEHTPIADDLEPGGNTEHVPTQAAATTALLARLAIPMIGLVMIGIFVGGYIAFSGEGGKPHHNSTRVAAAEPAPAPAPVAVAAPAAVAVAAPVADAVPAPVAVAAALPTPTAETAPTPAVAPSRNLQLVDIRIDSQPSGATVMLVDRGKTSFLGTTPIAASLDVSRRYDLIFTHDNKPTQIEHLDPKLTHHIEVVLGKPAAAPAMPAVAQAVAPRAEQKAPEPKKPEPKKPEPKKAAMTEAAAPAPVEHKATPVAAQAPKPDAVEQAAPTPMVAAPPTSKGTLMISSKPPCEIIIDGAPTGLTTPQRSIALAPGNHKITLVSATDPSIKKTVTIGVTAGKPTKVIQDLMK